MLWNAERASGLNRQTDSSSPLGNSSNVPMNTAIDVAKTKNPITTLSPLQLRRERLIPA